MTQEQRLTAAERLTGVLARTTGTAEHPTGLARVTATATGELKSLDLHPDAVARGADAVGRLVVETARLATDAAVQTSYDELAKSLGDGVAMAVEAFAGPPPLRAARSTGVTGWSGTPTEPGRPTAPPGEPGRPGAAQRSPEPGRSGARPGEPGRSAAPPRPDDPGRSGTLRRPVEPGRPDPARRPGDSGWSAARPRSAHPTAAGPGTTAAGPAGAPAPPWAGRRGSRPAPRPEPAETDDDDYFSDPFRGQRQ